MGESTGTLLRMSHVGVYFVEIGVSLLFDTLNVPESENTLM